MVGPTCSLLASQPKLKPQDVDTAKSRLAMLHRQLEAVKMFALAKL